MKHEIILVDDGLVLARLIFEVNVERVRVRLGRMIRKQDETREAYGGGLVVGGTREQPTIC